MRRLKRNRSGHQRHLRAHVPRPFGDGIAHLARRMIRQIAYRIERFLRRTGGDQYVASLQRQRIVRKIAVQQIRHGRFDASRLLHTSLADVATGKHAGFRLHDRPAKFPARLQIALRHGIGIHVHVHGGA